MGRYENSSQFTAALRLIAHAKSKHFKFPSFLYKEDDEDILFNFIDLNTFSYTEAFIPISDSNWATLVQVDSFKACIVSWGVEYVSWKALLIHRRDVAEVDNKLL